MSAAVIQVNQEEFGTFSAPDGQQQPVTKFTLTNSQGASVQLITFGASLTGISVPDKNGRLQDIVLGFDNLDGYLGVKARNPYFGAIVGRVANRIAKGKFTLDGVDYQLAINNGENHLHGGIVSFGKLVWQHHVHQDGRVTLTYSSPHMDEGYPGNLFAQITYRWTESNELFIDFKAMSDRPTPVNLASHAYYNLAGHDAGGEALHEHRVQLLADHYTPVDSALIPTGEIADVNATVFDLRTEKRLGDVILQVEGGGYDHNFVASGPPGALVARVWHPESGRLMQVFSDQPGFQFYTGNFLPSDGSLVGKNGTAYGKHGGLCVETQNFPDAINQPNFPDVVLRPGAVYQRTAIYKFGIQ